MRFCYSCMQQIDDEQQDICPHCGEKLEIEYDNDMCLKPGSILQENFIVGKLIGSGGFGNTYIGWNNVLKCKVAIKEYFPKQLTGRERTTGTVSVASDEISQQRFKAGLKSFMEEARNVAGLQDIEGVVQIYNFFEENGTGYIIMEFLEGMDVKNILKHRNNNVDYAWVRRVILTVLYTLREIHKRGVIHRDIAPDNIFVTNEGVIKLIDFGAAKHSDEGPNANSEIVLKAGYAPIEQYGRKVKQGPYTDLYAVAALFYRMLTGVKPQAANERIQSDNLQTLSDMGVVIPDQAEAAIMTCLNIQPLFRLQSADEFMEALEGTDFVPVYEPEWILPQVKDDHDTISHKFFDRIRRMSIWKKAGIGIAAAAVIGICIFAAVQKVGNVAKVSKVENAVTYSEKVPTYQVGDTIEDYVKTIEDKGCQTEVTYIYDDTVENEIVQSTEPEMGNLLPEDKVVKITVYGNKNVSIQNMNGLSVNQIEKKLSEAGISNAKSKVKFEYAYKKSAPKGKCYSQSMDGKVSSEQLSKFVFNISWGDKSDYILKIPKLKGKSEESARKQLSDLAKTYNCKVSLKVGDRRFSEKVKEGNVISQSVKAGKKYNTNLEDKSVSDKERVPKTINVVVSIGPKPTPTPEPTRAPELNNNSSSNNSSNNNNSSSNNNNSSSSHNSSKNDSPTKKNNTTTSQKSNNSGNEDEDDSGWDIDDSGDIDW